MTVQLNQRPVTEVPPQRPPEEEEEEEITEPDLEEIKNTVPLVEPRPLSNEILSEIALVQLRKNCAQCFMLLNSGIPFRKNTR